MKVWQIPEGKVASVSVGGVVLWQAETETIQLPTPEIELRGDTLVIRMDGAVETVAILVDGVEMTTVEV